MGANKVYDLGHTIFFVKATDSVRVFFYTRMPNEACHEEVNTPPREWG